MRTRKAEQGSALIIAVVVVIILSAMAVALLTEVIARFQTSQQGSENDEATMICRAGIERARRALYLYRANRTWNPSLPIAGGTLAGDYVEQWDSIFLYNQASVTGRYFPTPATPLQNVLEGVRANYALVRDDTEFDNYGNSPTAWNPNLWTADDAGLLPEDPDFLQSTVIFGACKPFRSGAYHIYLRDNLDEDPGDSDADGDLTDDDDGDGVVNDPLKDTDRMVICVVTAIICDVPVIGSGGLLDTQKSKFTMRQMTATLFYTPPTYAAGDMKSGGDISFAGSYMIDGNIFANGNLAFSGGAGTVTGTSEAAGSTSGSPGSGSPPVGGQDPIQLPEIDPVDIADDDPANTYHFSPSGIITGPSGFTWDTSTQGKWYGFDFSAGAWQLSGGTNPPAPVTEPDGITPLGTGTAHGGNGYIFHFQTDFKMSGAGNSVPMVATFLVEGNAEMGGNRTILPFHGNVAVMARRDLVVNGTSGNPNYPGLYAAHEQIQLQGGGGAQAPELYGAIIAEDAENISTLVNGITGADLTTGGNISFTGADIPTPIVLDSNVSVRNLLRTYPK